MAKQRARRASLALRLYVAGSAPNSALAVVNIRMVCDEHFAADHEIEIVDLLVHPERGLADGIIVTPTLVRVRPAPNLRLIGSLSDTQQVSIALASR